MTSTNGNKLVRDLVFEYIRQNDLLKCNKDKLPEVVSTIAEVSKILEASVNENIKEITFL